MSGYGGYTYSSSSHTGASPRSYSGSKTINTTDQVADRWWKPITSYTTNGNTDQYYVTNTEITIQQSCVYKYTQSSPIKVVGVLRYWGIVSVNTCYETRLFQKTAKMVAQTTQSENTILFNLSTELSAS